MGDHTYEPRSVEGPLVSGQRTTICILSSEQIKTSRLTSGLVKLINTAFLHGHMSKPELKMELVDRLGSTEEFLSAVASDPEAFIITLASPESQEIIGTASCVPWRGPPEVIESPWIRKLKPETGYTEWILKLMATKPSLQGQGLASFMLALVEREVLQRSRLICTGTTNPLIKMVLSSPKELNERFYTKKGYRKDYELPRGAGYNFHVIHMSKILEGVSYQVSG